MNKKLLELSDFSTGLQENSLVCPNCSSNYLHHGRIEIFNRGEDAEKGAHFNVNGSQVTLDDNLAGNPSGRRHGLKIHLDCEQCAAESALCISQHKGCTFVWVEYSSK